MSFAARISKVGILTGGDFTPNDLNLSNIFSDGTHIMGIMDWDEFGLGSPAIDFVVFAFDCTRAGAGAMADRLLTRAEAVSGHDGVRCLVSYPKTIASG